MRAWFLFFVVSVGVGGFFALLVALGRTPGVSSLLPAGIFYHWLVGHVDSALIIGFLSFLFVLWHRVLGEKPFFPEIALCGAGFLFVFLTSLLGLGKALYNNYVPTVLHPLFFAGLLLFGFGYLIATLRFLGEALGNLLSSDPLRSAVSLSVVLSLLLLLSVVLSLVLTPSGEPALYFERLYWIPGHIHQFINASLLISSWVLLSYLAGFKLPGGLKFLNLALIPFPLILLIVQGLGLDPLSPEVRRVTTLGYAVGIGIPTIAYDLYLIRRVAFRSGFYSQVLGLSLIFYLLGAGMGYLIAGSDLRVPAHYHAVIASVLVSVMGITYSLLRETGYVRDLPRAVRLQPLIYWSGMMLFVLGLFWAGVYGAPRKVFGTGYVENIELYVFLGLMGLGSVLSVLGGVMFVLYVIYSILRPRKGVRHASEGKA
jgi:hypothetical protein